MGKKFVWMIVLLSVFSLLCAACQPQVLPPSPEDIQTAIAQTQAAQPSPTPSPTTAPTNTPNPTPTQVITDTPTPSEPISGSISAAFLNLRSGPSTLFPILNTYVENTALTAIARVAENDWVQVEIEVEDEENEGEFITTTGWMSVDFLTLDTSPYNLPVAEFSDTQTIQGTVQDEEDAPLAGVIITVLLQTDEETIQTNITSTADGSFIAYVPEDLLGPFDVQIVGWECESPVVDLNCQLSGYIQRDERQFVTLPQEEPIAFVFESTEMTLSGNVTDSDGDAVNGVTVLADRDDGATSIGKTDALGDFIMPISAGTWEVYVVLFDPYEEGDPVSLEIADTPPEAIDLKLP